MRYLVGFIFALALSVMGCSETAGTGGSGGTAGSGGMGGDGGNGGVGGDVIEAIEEMMVGRWWLDWDQAGGGAITEGAIGLLTFTADGWVNYDVKFASIPCYTDWFRLYADWSLFDVVSETEFGFALTYTQGSCNREVGWTEEFRVVLDQVNPPKGQVIRLVFPEEPGIQWTMPIERCTTDINATLACTFDTGLGLPTENPAL
jgi:hypothetical protein